MHIAAGFLVGQQMDRAHLHALQACDRFLKEWASLHPLMAAARMAALQVGNILSLMFIGPTPWRLDERDIVFSYVYMWREKE